jgi:hypothetical protein
MRTKGDKSQVPKSNVLGRQKFQTDAVSLPNLAGEFNGFEFE